MQTLLQDLRYGVRMLTKKPGFTLLAMLTLALGIGANTAMFSIADVLFLRAPQHVSQAEQLVRVYPQGWWKSEGRSYPDFVDLRAGTTSFSGVAAYQPDIKRTVGRDQAAREITGARATAGFFPLLQVQPVLGRFYSIEEDGAPDAASVVVLGHEFWQRHFQGATDVLGQQLALGKRSYTIIGVAPAGFTGVELTRVDFWQPLGTIKQEDEWATWPSERGSPWLRVVARLKPGIQPATADADANAANQRGWQASGQKYEGAVMRIGPLLRARDAFQSREVKVTFWLLWVAAIVLFIACANVASLMLTRARERRREIAIKLALGAGRARIVRQLLTESLLLGLAGGGCALLVALWAAPLMRVFLLPENLSDIQLDARTLMFTAGLALLTSLLCGVIPAWQASRTNGADALHAGSLTTTAPQSRAGAALLVTQVALTVILLLGAGLFVRSLRKASAVELGLDTERLLTVTANLDTAGYSEAQSDESYQRMREALRALPGIAQVSLTVTVPFRSGWMQRLIPQGREGIAPPEYGRDFYNELINCVTPDFFATTGIKILRGRAFTAADRAGAPPVLIINEALARMIAPDGKALGKLLHIQTDKAPLAEVVGIAADAKAAEVLGKFDPQYYVPFDQPLVRGKNTTRALLIRTTGDPEQISELVRRTAQTAVPGLPYLDIKSMRREIEPQLLAWRLGANLFGLFALLALAIAAVGLYGIPAYAVAQRTRELGIRLALGATRWQVFSIVLRQGLVLGLAGLVLGLLSAAGLARLLESRIHLSQMFYGITLHDPLTYGVVSAVVVITALASGWIPARRATKVDPMIALRCE